VPSTRGDDVASPFAAGSTRATLAVACAGLRIESADAVLLRHGENAVYRLAHDPLVVRIACHPDVPRREVDVASWLAATGLSAVRLADIGETVTSRSRIAIFRFYRNRGRCAIDDDWSEAVLAVGRYALPSEYRLSDVMRVGSDSALPYSGDVPAKILCDLS